MNTPKNWPDILPAGRPALMGILNVTPDSFSDGGQFEAHQDAIAQAQLLHESGADIIDVGGESTRPGAQAISPETEIARVLPAIDALVSRKRIVSVDTRNAPVMARAILAGAAIVNDVSALTHDRESLDIVVEHQAPVILMHMKGDPASMNEAPHYDNVVAEVVEALSALAERYQSAGLSRSRIALDPGLGFAKNHRHNLALLQNLDQLVALDYPVCMGASRKLAKWTASQTVKLAVSISSAVVAAQKGAAILRVHDVAETRASLRVAGFQMP